MAKGFLPVRGSLRKSAIFTVIYILLYLSENYFPVSSFVDLGKFNTYIMPLFWIVFAFTISRFPRAKPAAKLKYRENIILWAVIFGILYILVNIGAGIVGGLGKSPYSHSFTGIVSNVIIIGSALVAREFLRAYLVSSLCKKESFIVFILISVLFTFCNFPINKYTGLEGSEEKVLFLAQFVLPELLNNIVATYFSYLGGIVPSTIFMGIIQGFYWLSPVLPDLKWIVSALVSILCPAYFLMYIQNLYMKKSSKKREEHGKGNPITWIITSLISIGLIWFVVGVFPVYPSVVATGSMQPMINPGDVILVNQAVDREKLKVGDVIQFSKDQILISHRIIEVMDGEEGKEYCTKGDNNSGADSENVTPQQIKGVVTEVIPKVGWPTLIIKNEKNIDLKDIEF